MDPFTNDRQISIAISICVAFFLEDINFNILLILASLAESCLQRSFRNKFLEKIMPSIGKLFSHFI